MKSTLYNIGMQIDVKQFKKQHVTVALSGGGDSVALLHYLKMHNIELAAVHIHHGIRQKEADADAAFVQELCAKWQIPLFLKKFAVPTLARQNKIGVEEMGRKVRYGVFHELLKGQTDTIVTAHHSGDFVESVLCNLFRGSGLKGMQGIASTLWGGKIVRPMLQVSKREILAYLQKNQLEWREDSSNQDVQYTRNFIRQSVLKDVERYFPQYDKKIYTFCQSAKQDDDCLQQFAKEALDIQEKTIAFSIDLPLPIFYRACIQAMQMLQRDIDYSNRHLQDLYNLKNLQTGKKISLPKGIVAVRSYQKILIFCESEQEDFCMPFQLGHFTCKGRRYCMQQVEYDIKALEQKRKAKNALYISGDNLQDVCIRTRRAGDVFCKFSGGTKKLKEYFIDKKVPAHVRDSIPLLAKGKEILAIFGVEIAKQVQIQENTKKIIELLEE